MARLVFCAAALTLSCFSWGKLIDSKAFQTYEVRASFKEACRSYGRDNLPFIEPIGKSQLDCMGEAFTLISFCQKKLQGRPLARAYIDSDEVVCLSSELVALSYQCLGKSEQKCQRPKLTCDQMGTFMAHDLALEKAFTLQEDSYSVLKCYFSARVSNEKKSIK